MALMLGASAASPANGAMAIGVRWAVAPVISIESCARALDAAAQLAQLRVMLERFEIRRAEPLGNPGELLVGEEGLLSGEALLTQCRQRFCSVCQRVRPGARVRKRLGRRHHTLVVAQRLLNVACTERQALTEM